MKAASDVDIVWIHQETAEPHVLNEWRSRFSLRRYGRLRRLCSTWSALDEIQILVLTRGTSPEPATVGAVMVHPITKPKTNVLEDPDLPLGAVLRVTLKFRARAIESD